MIVRFLVIFVALAALSSCQQSEANPEERHSKQVLAFNLSAEPPTLDPQVPADSASFVPLQLLFDGLMRHGEGYITEPAIADSVDISPDGKTYTFHLKRTRWSNGDPLTAHDFEYAWKRILAPSFPGEFAYQLYFIKGAERAKEGRIPVSQVGVQATDDDTLVVELENPTPFFLDLLTIPTFAPIPSKVVENNPNWALEASPSYVSNGPFLLREWTHHNQIVVERNPHYWDADKVKLNKIILSIVPDPSTELALFENGALDWAGKPLSSGLPSDSLPTLQSTGKLRYQPMPATGYFIFNINQAPFNNAKIRRAFALAINRHDIVNNILKGGEQPATCFVPPPLSLQHQECFHDADLKEARKLFAQGLKELQLTKDQLPPITLSYNTSEGHHKIAQAVQQQWNEAFGIPILLQNLEWKVYLDKLAQRDFSIARMGWHADYNDPYSFLDLFKHADNSANYNKWHSSRYTKLLDRAQRIQDSRQRKQVLASAEEVLIEQMPILPLYFLTNTYLVTPELKGYYFGPTGDVDFRHAYFEKAGLGEHVPL